MLALRLASFDRLRQHLLVGMGVLPAVLSVLFPAPAEAQTWDPWVRVALWAGYSHHCNGCEFEGSRRGGQFVLKVELTPKGFFSSPGALTLGGSTSAGGISSNLHMPWVGPPVREQFDENDGVLRARGSGPAEMGPAYPLYAGSVIEVIPFELSQRLACSSSKGINESAQNDYWNEFLRIDFKAVLGLGFTLQDDIPRILDGVARNVVMGGIGLVASPGLTVDFTPFQEGTGLFSHSAFHIQLRVPLHLVHSDVIHADGFVERRGLQVPGAGEAWTILGGYSLPLGKSWRTRPDNAAVVVSHRFRQPDAGTVRASVDELVTTSNALLPVQQEGAPPTLVSVLGTDSEPTRSGRQVGQGAAFLNTYANRTLELFDEHVGTATNARDHTAKLKWLLADADGLLAASQLVALGAKAALAALGTNDDPFDSLTATRNALIRATEGPAFARQYREWLKRKQIMCGNPERSLW